MLGKLEKRYSYYADGNLSFVKDLLDNRSDRYFSYDQMGRIAKAYGGYIARGEQSSGPNNPSYYNQFVPIKNDYAYNAFSNPVIRKEANSTSYRTDIEFQYHQVDMQRNYVNNRSPNGVRSWDNPWAYDADGRLIEDGNLSFDPYHTIGYDAAGSARKMRARDGGVIDEKTSVYDGNRQAAKEAMYVSVTTVDENGNTLPPVETTTHKYFLRSTPLGGSLIGLINENGSIGNLYVSAGGNRIATYSPISGTYSKFRWEHSDSHGISGYNSSYDQKQYSASYPNEDLTLPGKSESDPHGREISGLPQLSELSGSGGGYNGGPSEIAGGIWDNFNCTLDGVNTSCGWAIQFLSQNGGSPVYEAPPDQVASVWDNASRSFVRLPYSTTSTSERGLAYSRRSRGWLPSGFLDDPLIIPDIPDGCRPGPDGSIICIVTVIPDSPEPLVINIAAVGFRVDNKPQQQTQGPCEGLWDCFRKILDEYNKQREIKQRACDTQLADLFGGPGAVASTTREMTFTSRGTNERNSDNVLMYENNLPGTMIDRTDHLANDGVFHISPDLNGTDTNEVGLFVPAGAHVNSLRGERKQGLTGSPTNTFSFGWSRGPFAGVTVVFDHVGGTNGGDYGGQNLDSGFVKNNRLIGPTNAAGSTQIGLIGGLGGRQPESYRNRVSRHTHAGVYKKGKKIDPRKAFCGWK